MFDFVMSFFPLRARSFNDFIMIVGQEKCSKVYGTVEVTVKGGVNTASVGVLGTFRYNAMLLSWTSSGRRVIFKELVEKRWGSAGGFSDVGERGLLALKSYAAIYNRLQEVKKSFPDTETGIVGGSGDLFDENRMRDLERDMRQYGLID